MRTSRIPPMAEKLLAIDTPSITDSAYPNLNMDLRIITSSCTFQMLRRRHEPASILQRHAFEAWAEIDMQLIPATPPTLDQESNGPTTRQPSPSNEKKDPASVHNQIKMKPPPAETLVVYPDGSYHRADQRRTGCGFVIVSGGATETTTYMPLR